MIYQRRAGCQFYDYSTFMTLPKKENKKKGVKNMIYGALSLWNQKPTHSESNFNVLFQLQQIKLPAKGFNDRQAVVAVKEFVLLKVLSQQRRERHIWWPLQVW